MAKFGCHSISEGFDYTIPPILENIDFLFWKARMTSFIKSCDYDMWNVFIHDFDFKPRKDWTVKEKKMFSLNIRAMKILYSGLTEDDFEKIKSCSSAKSIWNTLDSLYTSNNFVEVESVGSSSKITSSISTQDELMEADIEEGEIIENFHEPANTEREEKGDSGEEPIVEETEKSSSGAQNILTVKDSNSSCVNNKTDFETMHKIVFQPIINAISKSKNIFNQIEKSVGKKESSQKKYLTPHTCDQHNTCKNIHNKYYPIICNYCGKQGHISHSCHFRRNPNVRNKFVWIPKGQVKSNDNNQGPKTKWVPKCPFNASCVQNNSGRRNGLKGTRNMKKNPKVSHAPNKRFIESASVKRSHGESAARVSKSNHKQKQWIQRNRAMRPTLKMNYHRVPFNYLEVNKRRNISGASNIRYWKSTSFQTIFTAPNNMNRKFQWVNKGNPSST